MIRDVEERGLSCWANDRFDSYGLPVLKDVHKDTPKGQLCPVCRGKKEIFYSSCCLPKIQPCPCCATSKKSAPQDPSIPSRQYVGHTQIVHYINGKKQSIFNVQKHWENDMVHVLDGTGKEWIINKQNVLCVEVIP